MADIRLLVVADGPYLKNTPVGGGISFAPNQDPTDNTFTISEFIYLLQNSQAPTISIDTAHRRQDRDTSTSPPTIYPDFENFNFATSTNLENYDVIWLFAYEGWNDGLNPNASPISAAEVAAIGTFMDSGGGIFATGDHYGMGSLICGQIPRVGTMRKWWGRAVDQPAGYPAQVLDWSGAAVTSVNRPAFSTQSAANPPFPANPSDPSMNRADTTQLNPEASGPAPDTSNIFQFDDQSDAIPQTLSFPGDVVHPILQGQIGAVTQFPDHMHEGEVVTPAVPVDPTEYPSIGGYQPLPAVIATGQIVPNHATHVDGASCEQGNFSSDPTYTAGGKLGVLCAYDGRGANKGRIVTDSSWHHYLDVNLIGDPCGSTADRMQGFGPAKTPPASGGVLAGLQTIYVNTVAWLARQNPNFYFVVDKSTYGSDESATGATFAAFWLVIEGYTLAQVQAAVTANSPQFAGAFAALGAISPPGALIAEGGPNSQRILIPYSVTFPASAIAMGAFPSPGNPAKQMLLIGRLSVTASGSTTSFSAETDIELTSGADPYFQNVNPSTNNAFYLSQDLCVFTVNPQQSTTIPGVPGVAFPPTNTTVRNTNAGNSFITQLLSTMNGDAAFTDPGNSNPFANFPSVIDGTGDSSVTGIETINSTQYVNYNFAVARVRLQGAPGVSTNPKTVRVFFRLFLTQTNDTDFQPSTTYLSQLDMTTGLPRAPLSAPDGTSQPFFATGAASGDYLSGSVNNFVVTVGASGDTSAYFGCHLDVFDPANNAKYPGTHHCIVAQIAYDDDPIVNANGVTLGPENSDKLAQRNLQITKSGNPGGPDAHRIPQTFDTRPSAPTGMPLHVLQGYPDELAIEWGDVPLGSTATIYWPAVDALEVVRLAMRLHSTDQLTVVDPHTIQCTVKSAVTYVPIPLGTGAKFAGLFTIDLPVGVRAGQEFDVLVRRISTRKSEIRDAPAPALVKAPRAARRATAHAAPHAATKSETASRDWRYVVGTFQVKIPVAHDHDLLLPEENTLAILKWRLLQTPHGSRWYPVLVRYIEYLSGRVNAFGGNAGSVLPSPTGVPVPTGGGGGKGPHAGHGEEFTGKVESITYDRFGDFEGFHLLTEAGHHREFRSREPEIERLVRFAWENRVVISVRVRHHHPERPVSIVLRRAPIL